MLIETRVFIIVIFAIIILSCDDTKTSKTNNPPQFTSSSTVSTVENITTTGYTAIATDADNDTVTFSLSGGVDKDKFEIGHDTGILVFKSAPDFENPSSYDLSNNYTIIISASDGTTHTEQIIIVSVVNELMQLTSTSFANGTAIPLDNVYGQPSAGNKSPQLTWTEIPANVNTFAIIMDDENCGDGKEQACKHWAIYNIPATTHSLLENITISDPIVQGLQYRGPSPPPNSLHNYKITVYALKDSMDNLSAGTAYNRTVFVNNFSSHIIDSATISGTYFYLRD